MTNEEFIKSVSLPDEEWRDVVGYEGIYMVSSLGRIASMERKVQCGNIPKIIPFKIKSTRIRHTTPNYSRESVSLSCNGNDKNFFVHRLVAEAFIPNPNNYPDIDHINGSPLCNSVSNLRWCNEKMNQNNPITKQRLSDAMKGRPCSNGLSKQVCQLSNGNIIHIFNSSCETEKYGFYPSSVRACCRGKIKSHKGYKFMWLSDYETLIKSKDESIQAKD